VTGRDWPTVQEIAELTAELRRLSQLSWDVDPAERAAFLAAKRELLGRIEEATK
jgi:hypothetical protein